MAPFVKDAENAVATPSPAAPAAPGAPAAKTPVEPPARPQPVAMEIPVTVNGGRSIEGSDKREPFSETTQTVLVFGYGAVIRLASALAPGQLVFLTNEKTKKEVVCQVVKSKSYRNVSGYVELEFTEPSIGFWGMRLPGDRPAPAASATATPRLAVPGSSVAHATPKVVPPAAPPVATKPTLPMAPTAVDNKPAVAPPQPSVKPEPTKSLSLSHASLPVMATPSAPPPVAVPPAPVVPLPPVAVKADPLPGPPLKSSSGPSTPFQPSPLFVPILPVLPPPPVASKPETISTPTQRPMAANSARVEPPPLPTADVISPPPAAVKPEAAPVPSPMSEPAKLPTEPSTEELKLQAARLQEQLSTLLFTGVKTAPPPPPSPETSPAPSPKQEPTLAEAAKRAVELNQPEAKAAEVKEIKTVPTPQKTVPASLPMEEVKIPSWLAPLARETRPIPVVAASRLETPSASESLAVTGETPQETFSRDADETLGHAETVVFGGQLLAEPSPESTAGTSGPNKGLFVGLAAAALLLAGGVWYLRPTAKPVSGSTALRPATASGANFRPLVATPPLPKTDTTPAVGSSNLGSTPAPAPVTSSSNTPAPTASAPVPLAAPTASTNSNANSRNTLPAEQPKKPVLGNVHLAAPVVSRPGKSQEPTEGEFAIENNQTASSGDPILSLETGNRNGPVMPAPVGGDLKPARQLKSVPPIYPPVAKTQHISGDVKIDALIDANGNVTTMKILSGPAILHQAAMTAVKQWKYEPAQLDGQATAMHLTVTVQFRF
jgi:TonB family protein